MIGQTRVRLGAAAGVVTVLATLLAVYLLSASSVPQPERVSAFDLIDGHSYEKMKEAGIFITDDSPAYQPPISLAEAAEYLEEEAGVRSLRGALIMVNSTPANPNTGFIPITLSESLVWAIRVDPSRTSLPDLFDPDAPGTIAFVDADGAGLLGVLAQ